MADLALAVDIASLTTLAVPPLSSHGFLRLWFTSAVILSVCAVPSQGVDG
jgi:hypothetical protein